MNLKTLELIGLNKYESSIYLALAKHPGITAAEISKYSEVPQNRVYDVVEHLITQKLAYLIPENPKKYAPENPKIVRKLIKNKLNELEKLDKKFETLEEDFKVINTQNVIVSRTKKNFDKIFDSIPKAEKFDYSIQPKLTILSKFLKNAKNMNEIGVQQLSLTDYNMKDSSNLKKWKKYQENFKLIETHNIAMNITDKGFLISLIPPENESLIIFIESKNLANLMKKMYKAYYDSLEN